MIDQMTYLERIKNNALEIMNVESQSEEICLEEVKKKWICFRTCKKANS